MISECGSEPAEVATYQLDLVQAGIYSFRSTYSVQGMKGLTGVIVVEDDSARYDSNPLIII